VGVKHRIQVGRGVACLLWTASHVASCKGDVAPAPVVDEPPHGGEVSGEFDVFVTREGRVFRWQEQPLRTNDQLRYSFRVAEPLQVMVVHRDARGNVSRSFPESPTSLGVERGATLTKVAAQLGDTVGRETLWGVFCRTPFGFEDWALSLREGGEPGPREHCAVQRRTLQKE
jgi:hypothetical protein